MKLSDYVVSYIETKGIQDDLFGLSCEKLLEFESEMMNSAMVSKK